MFEFFCLVFALTAICTLFFVMGLLAEIIERIPVLCKAFEKFAEWVFR